MKLSRWKPVCGIYKITNVKNGKVYIGQSINITIRWATHADGLVRGTHENAGLLADFREYGIRAFEVEIIEKCKRNKMSLNEREEFYIWQYREQGFVLYNSNIPNFRHLLCSPIKEMKHE